MSSSPIPDPWPLNPATKEDGSPGGHTHKPMDDSGCQLGWNTSPCVTLSWPQLPSDQLSLAPQMANEWLTPPLAPNPAASPFLDNNAGSEASTWSQPLLIAAGWARQRKSWQGQKQGLFILRWPQQPGRHGEEWAARPQQTIKLYQVRRGCRGCKIAAPLAKSRGHLHLI